MHFQGSIETFPERRLSTDYRGSWSKRRLLGVAKPMILKNGKTPHAPSTTQDV